LAVVYLYHSLSKKAEWVLNNQIQKSSGADVDFLVHYWGAVTNHYDNPVHKHAFFEICYVMDGAGEYIDDGESFVLSPGVIFCSRPGIWHQILSQSGLFLLFVAFEVKESTPLTPVAERFRKLAESRSFHIAHAEETTAVLLWKALLIQAAENYISEDLLTGLAHMLLISFPQMFLEPVEIPIKKQDRTTSSIQLYQAQLFIRDNLSQPLHMEKVAGYLHLSIRHLSRLFSEQLGITFNNYVRQERLSHALHLLKFTNASIKQIAIESGFETVHYFTRVFTTEMRISPGRYRQTLGTQFLN
jgi:AraC-like DNA-binding protein/mannose-6-phosphate isomerase-like protein (cupin superfamily)